MPSSELQTVRVAVAAAARRRYGDGPLYRHRPGLGVDMGGTYYDRTRAAAACALCLVLFADYISAAPMVDTSQTLRRAARCRAERQCEWGSTTARQAGIVALNSVTACPTMHNPVALYAQRLLETHQHPGIPCPDMGLAVAFALANATLQCPILSALPLTSPCEQTVFLTPSMHAVTVVLLTLVLMQAAAAHVAAAQWQSPD